MGRDTVQNRLSDLLAVHWRYRPIGLLDYIKNNPVQFRAVESQYVLPVLSGLPRLLGCRLWRVFLDGHGKQLAQPLFERGFVFVASERAGNLLKAFRLAGRF